MEGEEGSVVKCVYGIHPSISVKYLNSVSIGFYLKNSHVDLLKSECFALVKIFTQVDLLKSIGTQMLQLCMQFLFFAT